MPFREFARLKLVASVNSEGNTTMKFEPLPAPLVEDNVGPNVLFHFQSSFCNGINTLTVYVSPVGPTSTSTNDDRSGEPLSSLPGSEFLETPDSSFKQWAGEMSNLNPLFSPFQTSSLQRDSTDVSHAPPGLISHPEMNKCYSPFLQDYGDGVDALRNNLQYWTDPTIFAMPFPNYPSLTSSVPTSPSGTTSPASNFSESSTDDLASVSSPEAVHQCSPHHLSVSDSEAPRQTTSSSSLAPRHRPHSRSRRSGSYPDHLSRGVPSKSSFPCTFEPCPEVFSRKHDRMRHEVAQHGLKCQWVCNRCRKFFASEKTLAKHRCSVNSDVRWTTPVQSNSGQDGVGTVPI
ncbi:MAG: hypothetical protein NXY57DRAFT_958789 [Lentinula lateritia]|nr:MAG: hypothetical protein NXY57DRAFT_958789 [Lentinula lateritia]